MTTTFSVDLTQTNGQTVIRFIGELDMAQVEMAEMQARGALANGRTGPLIIDVSDLTFCDSSGIRVLLSLEDAAAQRGRDVVLRHPRRALRLVIEALGLESHFHVEPETTRGPAEDSR